MHSSKCEIYKRIEEKYNNNDEDRNMETIGVDDPAIQWITTDIKKAVDRHENATPAQIIAALDTYKLEYQLRIFGIIEDD